MSDDDKIEVKVSANTEGLKSGMDDSARKTEETTERIKKKFQELQSEFKKTEDLFKKGLNPETSKMKEWGDEAKRVFLETRTNEEKVANEQAKLNALLKAGAIDAETFNRAMSKFNVHPAVEGGGFFTTMKEGGEKAAGAMEMLNRAFLAITAVLAGGQIFKEVVGETAKITSEAIKLERAFGMDSEAASALNIALEDVFATSDQYTESATKLERQLKTNEAGLNKMGLATRDSSGHLKDLNTLMLDAVEVVNSYKQGTDRNLASMTLFGARSADLAGILMLTKEGMEEAKEKQEALGLTVTEKGQKAYIEYKKALVEVNDVFMGIKKAIGDAVIPVLTSLAKEFSDNGPSAVELFSAAIKGLLTAFELFKLQIQVMGSVVSNVMLTLMDLGEGFADFWKKVLSGDFSGAMEVAKHNLKIFGEDAKRVFTEVKDVADDNAKKIAAIWDPDKSGAAKVGTQGDKTMGEMGTKHSRVPEWETELEELKTHLAEEANAKGQYFKMSEQQELEYWQKVKAQHQLSQEEDISVRKKTATLGQEILKNGFEATIAKLKEEEAAARNNAEAKIAIAKQESDRIKQYYGEGSKEYQKALQHEDQLEKEAAKQRLEIAKATAEQIRDVKLQAVQADEDYAKLQYDLGNITNAQLLQQELVFEDRMNEIKRQALQARADMLDPQSDPVAKAQIDAQIEALELQHQQKMRQIRNQQATNEKNKDPLKDLGTDLGAATGMKDGGTLGNSIFGSFSNALDNMSSRAKTFRQNIEDMNKSLYQSFMQNLVVNPLKQYSAAIARMIAEKIGLLTQSQAADKTSDASAIISAKAKAAAIIPAEASTAAGGAASAMASIPYVGPALAAAAYAETFALVMSGLATASAAGGYDIDAGVNPVTQLHAKEMVLPAKYADVIRGMADGGSDGSGATNIHIHAADGKSVQRMLMSQDRTIAKALVRAVKNGVRS